MDPIPCFARHCDAVCDSLVELLAHFKIAHKMKSFQPVSCKYKACTRSFTNQRTFIKHFKLVHEKDSNLHSPVVDESVVPFANTHVSEHENDEMLTGTPSVYLVNTKNVMHIASPIFMNIQLKSF